MLLLVLQPIVENAVKHGIATLRLGGDVRVSARVERSGTEAAQLSLVVEDTGAGATADALRLGREAGVGLRNVERRLACQDGAAASLLIRTTPGTGTTVEDPAARRMEGSRRRGDAGRGALSARLRVVVADVVSGRRGRSLLPCSGTIC